MFEHFLLDVPVIYTLVIVAVLYILYIEARRCERGGYRTMREIVQRTSRVRMKKEMSLQ